MKEWSEDTGFGVRPLRCAGKAAPRQERLVFASARTPWELSIWNHVILISQLQHFLNHDNNINNPNPNPKSMCERINHSKLPVKRSFSLWDHRLVQPKNFPSNRNLFCSPDPFQQSSSIARAPDFCGGFSHGSLRCHFLPPPTSINMPALRSAQCIYTGNRWCYWLLRMLVSCRLWYF